MLPDSNALQLILSELASLKALYTMQAQELSEVKAQLQQLQQPAVQWSCALGPEHSNCRCEYAFEAGSVSPSSVAVTCTGT